jgi:hypothetical protein
MFLFFGVNTGLAYLWKLPKLSTVIFGSEYSSQRPATGNVDFLPLRTHNFEHVLP